MKKYRKVILILTVILLNVLAMAEIYAPVKKYIPARAEYSKAAKANAKEIIALTGDVIGWIKLKGTIIDYPIVQGDDNEFYLYHLYNGDYSRCGSIFVDYACENPFEDNITLIYGHSMRDGSMFHELKEFKEQSYYNKHKTMDIRTRSGKFKMKIFAAEVIDYDQNSELFKTCLFDEEKKAYVNEIKERSLIETGIDVKDDDKIIMLVTCTQDLSDDRMTVFGVLSS